MNKEELFAAFVNEDKRFIDWDEAFATYAEEIKQRNLKDGKIWAGMTEDDYLRCSGPILRGGKLNRVLMTGMKGFMRLSRRSSNGAWRLGSRGRG